LADLAETQRESVGKNGQSSSSALPMMWQGGAAAPP